MKAKKLIWLLPLSIILYACPFESNVPLAPQPTEAIDSSLIGYWYGIVKDGSDYFGIEALEISKESDSVYSIIRYGKAIKGDMILPDTAHFTGYISYLGDQRFMNIESSVVSVTTRKNKPPVVTTTKVYYMARMDVRNDTMQVRTLTETFSPTRKIFRSPEELKQAILTQAELKTNIFDDQYSLAYHRIPKPRPMKAF